ncbi:MAG: hypothetical protein JNK56_36120 [Myxococcales bacterium]|nr:hypothetical protein [Myxococcales bacterium]
MIGFGVAGATFAYAKKQQASNGTAAAAATATGVGTAVVGSLVLAASSVLIPAALVGGIGYWYFKRGDKPKALRAGR